MDGIDLFTTVLLNHSHGSSIACPLITEPLSMAKALVTLAPLATRRVATERHENVIHGGISPFGRRDCLVTRSLYRNDLSSDPYNTLTNER